MRRTAFLPRSDRVFRSTNRRRAVAVVVAAAALSATAAPALAQDTGYHPAWGAAASPWGQAWGQQPGSQGQLVQEDPFGLVGAAALTGAGGPVYGGSSGFGGWAGLVQGDGSGWPGGMVAAAPQGFAPPAPSSQDAVTGAAPASATEATGSPFEQVDRPQAGTPDRGTQVAQDFGAPVSCQITASDRSGNYVYNLQRDKYRYLLSVTKHSPGEGAGPVQVFKMREVSGFRLPGQPRTFQNDGLTFVLERGLLNQLGYGINVGTIYDQRPGIRLVKQMPCKVVPED